MMHRRDFLRTLAAAGVVGGGIALHAAVSALKSAQKKTQTSVSKEEA